MPPKTHPRCFTNRTASTKHAGMITNCALVRLFIENMVFSMRFCSQLVFPFNIFGKCGLNLFKQMVYRVH